MDKKQKTIDYCIKMALMVNAIKEDDKDFIGNLLAVAYSDGKMAGFNEAIELRHKYEYKTEEQLIERERVSGFGVSRDSTIL